MNKPTTIVSFLIISTSSVFCMTPVMSSTSEDVLHYGENPMFRASFPFDVKDSEGNSLGLCSGSFVDVDGDVFFVTAAHCFESKNAQRLELGSIIHKGFSNDKGFIDLKESTEQPYLAHTFDSEVVMKNPYAPTRIEYPNDRKSNYELREKKDRLNAVDQENPLKIFNILYQIASVSDSHDMAFFPLGNIAIPSHITPFKLYKGQASQLVGEKVTSVGFGIHPSNNLFFDLLKDIGCLVTDYYCEEGHMRQAADLEIFGKLARHNKFLVYPLASDSDISAELIHGDSGGPALYKDKNENLFIVGVTSSGRDVSDMGQAIPAIKEAIDALNSKGSTQIHFIQFIDPGILEKARFEMHGWLNAIDQKNESLLLKAIQDGILGSNHDSRALLLNRAIDNEMWELAAELVHQGISNVYNFEVLFSLADKKAWEIFDSVVGLINTKFSIRDNSDWIKNMYSNADLDFSQMHIVHARFKAMLKALNNNNRNEVVKNIKEIERIRKRKF